MQGILILTIVNYKIIIIIIGIFPLCSPDTYQTNKYQS